MRWKGACSTQCGKRNAHKVSTGKPEGMKILGRPKSLWKGENKVYLKEIR